MKHAMLPMLLMLCACTSLPTGSVRPPDPPEMRAVDADVAAWHAAGYPINESSSAALHKLVVLPRATDEQVAQLCDVPACGGSQPPLPLFGCAYACTVYIDEAWPFNHSTPIIVISEHVPDSERARGEPVIHETLHVLAPSLLGHNDRLHRDTRLWTALQSPACIQTQARARYAE